MPVAVNRQSVDLSAFPELIVVLLGFKVRRPRALLSLRKIGAGLAQIGRDPPDGLLASDQFLWSFTHLGIRHYWRDLDALERFTRSAPHAEWWRDFLRDNGGGGFWHETYSRRGMEAVYLDMPEPIGMRRFAAARTPNGPFMSSRARLSDDQAASAGAAVRLAH